MQITFTGLVISKKACAFPLKTFLLKRFPSGTGHGSGLQLGGHTWCHGLARTIVYKYDRVGAFLGSDIRYQLGQLLAIQRGNATCNDHFAGSVGTETFQSTAATERDCGNGCPGQFAGVRNGLLCCLGDLIAPGINEYDGAHFYLFVWPLGRSSGSTLQVRDAGSGAFVQRSNDLRLGV